MCKEWIQWWQSRTVSAAPVAVWTSSAGEVRTTSTGPFHNVYVIVPLQVLGDGGAQEPEWLHCSHSAVHDGEWGESRGVSPEVHDHIHSFEHVKAGIHYMTQSEQICKTLGITHLPTI